VILTRLRDNFSEAVRSFRRSDYWLVLFLAGGALALGALLALHPGDTLGYYPVYLYLDEIPDRALGGALIALALGALLARTPRQRRAVTAALCLVWGGLAVAIVAGNLHYTATRPGVGPSGANVHYLGWAVLSFLVAVRSANADAKADA